MDERFQQAKVVIVDDEYSNVLLLKRTLEQLGITSIRGLTDPTQVVDLVLKFKPDILLLDLNMPALDGFAVMKNVKAIVPPDDFLPILVLTADISQETKRRALSDGANDYLTKPFDLFEVMLRTRNLLRTRFLQTDLKEQNADLETKVRERTSAANKAQRETIECLAKACEARDDATGEHTKRVGAMSARIALTLGLSDAEAEMIQLAAQLHDIGKTAIPDGILAKPGKLTPAEYDVMKQHPVLGAAILAGSSSPMLVMAEQIAATHHEWWNGRGYPSKLCGDQIPLAGRIVAVSDVFDALTHERPYKKAWSVSEAIDEIKGLGHQQFDPKVVDALIEVLAASGLADIDFARSEVMLRKAA